MEESNSGERNKYLGQIHFFLFYQHKRKDIQYKKIENKLQTNLIQQ